MAYIQCTIYGITCQNWLTTKKSVTLTTQLNPLSANPTKCSNTLKQFVSKLPTNCLSVFDHFVKLVLKGLILRSIPYLPSIADETI